MVRIQGILGARLKKTVVLIPAYNEARSIGGIIKDLKEKGLSVYVIDDGSTDDTSAIALKEGANVLKHDKNKGKGASIRDGIQYALKENFDAVLILDGDGQHKTSDVDNFFAKMDGASADIVIGNRMHDTSAMPFARHVTNRVMSYVISKLCGHDIPDTQCGFRLINIKVLKSVKLESSNYEIESELLLKAAKKGFKIESIPIQTVYENETSNINPLVDTVRFIVFLVKTLVGR